MKIQPGLYRHYKGNEYKVIGTALHSETLEELVVYAPLYENGKSDLWVRPAKMFFEEIEINGKRVKRFERLSD